MSGPKSLKKGDLLFREGDPSEAMYVVKSGKIAITKSKGTSEIVLAELSPGDMLGEMAFFDNKPRSASARAAVDSVVIELPFKALNAQFKSFPEWLKAVVRTVNNHLRNANQRIKNLERSTAEDDQVLPPHMVTRLGAILGLIGHRYGERADDGTVTIPPNRLRNFCIQVFQAPTNRLEKLMALLASKDYLKVEDLGEGRQRITTKHLDFIIDFVDFYNTYLFAPEDKRITLEERELRPLKTLLHYSQGTAPDEKGLTKVNLTEIQNSSMKDLGYLCAIDDFSSMVGKKLFAEPVTRDGGVVLMINREEIAKMHPYWELIHAFAKMARD